jgi:hypothetical protein
MSNNKQSSVDWLINVVQSCIAPDYIPQEIVQQAKAMHEQEIKRAFIIGGGVEYHEINTHADEYFIEEFNQ